MSLSLAARSPARGSARVEGARRGLPCAPLPASTSFQKKPSVFSGVFGCPPYQESVQQGLPGHFLLSVLSLPAPPSLLLGPFTRPLVREREGKKKKTTHSFTTFSTTAAIFPAPLPQAGRPEARNAQAPSLLRAFGPQHSAQAQPKGVRARARAGERARRSPVRRRDWGGALPRLLGLEDPPPPVSGAWERRSGVAAK